VGKPKLPTQGDYFLEKEEEKKPQEVERIGQELEKLVWKEAEKM